MSVHQALAPSHPERYRPAALVSRVVSLIAIILVFMLTPGAVELVENAAHMVSEGHSAHAFDDAGHTPEGDEHGCSGTFHACSCHASPVFIVGQSSLAVSMACPATTSHLVDHGARLTRGYDLGVFRPPST